MYGAIQVLRNAVGCQIFWGKCVTKTYGSMLLALRGVGVSFSRKKVLRNLNGLYKCICVCVGMYVRVRADIHRYIRINNIIYKIYNLALQYNITNKTTFFSTLQRQDFSFSLWSL